jgi:hypothetical protein
MSKLRLALFGAALVASAALAATAHATDAAHAWGTVSNPGEILLNSAATHNQEGQAAQVARHRHHLVKSLLASVAMCRKSKRKS